MKYCIITFFCVLCSPQFAFPQKSYSSVDFSMVDSLARSIKYDNDIFKLTGELTKPYVQAIYKARSIFIWVTNNIKYDYDHINKGKEIKVPDCDATIDCRGKMEEWENNYLKKVLRKKKAICDGYARLLQRMLNIAGIPNEIITGYARTKAYEVGNPMSLNHAWNAILIDSSYYFLDPTWAAGYCIEDEESGMLTSFVKKYNDYYWLTPSKALIRNHYPQNGRWVYEVNYPKERFFENPYYSSLVIEDIKLLSPASGVIKAKKGDTLHFKFEYPDLIKYLQVNTNANRNPAIYEKKKLSRKRYTTILDSFALKKQRYINYKRKDNIYEFSYVVMDNSTYYLDLLFNYTRVMRFRIKMTDPDQ
jgi:Transglutaminase-like domain